MPNNTTTIDSLTDLLDATEGDLRATYMEMQKPAWVLAVGRLKAEGANDPEKKELWKKALRLELDVLQAIQEIDLLNIQEIAKGMKQHQEGLRKARKSLRDQHANISEIGDTIKNTANLLSVLNKFIPTIGRLLD